MQAEFRTHLLADATVSALIGARAHWQVAPQRQTFPFVVLTRISDSATYVYSGEIAQRQARIQIDCYSETAKQAQEVQSAIQAHIAGTRFTQNSINFEGCFVLDGREFTEDNQAIGSRIYRNSQDYQVFYK